MIYTPLEQFSIISMIIPYFDYSYFSLGLYFYTLFFIILFIVDVLRSNDAKIHWFLAFAINYTFFLGIFGQYKTIVNVTLITIFFIFIISKIETILKLKKFFEFLIQNRKKVFFTWVISVIVTIYLLTVYSIILDHIHEFRRIFLYSLPYVLCANALDITLKYNFFTRLCLIFNFLLSILVTNYYIGIGFYYLNLVFDFIPTAMCDDTPAPTYPRELDAFFCALSAAQALTIKQKLGIQLTQWPLDVGFVTTRDIKSDLNAYSIFSREGLVHQYKGECQSLSNRIFRIQNDLTPIVTDPQNSSFCMTKVLDWDECKELCEFLECDNTILLEQLNIHLMVEKYYHKDLEITYDIDFMLQNNVSPNDIIDHTLQELKSFYSNRSSFRNARVTAIDSNLKRELWRVRERVADLDRTHEGYCIRFGKEIDAKYENNRNWGRAIRGDQSSILSSSSSEGL